MMQPFCPSQARSRATWLAVVTAPSVIAASSASISGRAAAAILRAASIRARSNGTPRSLTPRSSSHSRVRTAAATNRRAHARPRRPAECARRTAKIVRDRQTSRARRVFAFARAARPRHLHHPRAFLGVLGSSSRSARRATPVGRQRERKRRRHRATCRRAGSPGSRGAVEKSRSIADLERVIMRRHGPIGSHAASNNPEVPGRRFHSCTGPPSTAKATTWISVWGSAAYRRAPTIGRSSMPRVS